MKTKGRKELINSFLSELGDEIKPLYQDIIKYLAELGNNPIKQKDYLLFKHVSHTKPIAKMGIRERTPYLSLKYSACKGYSEKFAEIVKEAIIKYPARAARCTSGGCIAPCMGEPESHVYAYAFPDGEIKSYCGAHVLEIPGIKTDDIEEIKRLIKEEHIYLMKYEAGISEEKQMSDQQKTKPKIEYIISGFLDGEMKKNALDFIAYLRENKMSVSRASGNAEAKRMDGAWKATYKGKGICRIWLSKNHWIVCPYVDYTKDFESYIKNENLQGIIWDNLFKCRICSPKLCSSQSNKPEETFKGFNKTFFGKEFEDICKFWDVYFQNPDGRTVNCIKRMIDFKRIH